MIKVDGLEIREFCGVAKHEVAMFRDPLVDGFVKGDNPRVFGCCSRGKLLENITLIFLELGRSVGEHK